MVWPRAATHSCRWASMLLVMHNPKEPLLLPSTSFVVFIRSLSKKAVTAAATSSLSAFASTSLGMFMYESGPARCRLSSASLVSSLLHFLSLPTLRTVRLSSSSKIPSSARSNCIPHRSYCLYVGCGLGSSGPIAVLSPHWYAYLTARPQHPAARCKSTRPAIAAESTVAGMGCSSTFSSHF